MDDDRAARRPGRLRRSSAAGSTCRSPIGSRRSRTGSNRSCRAEHERSRRRRARGPWRSWPSLAGAIVGIVVAYGSTSGPTGLDRDRIEQPILADGWYIDASRRGSWVARAAGRSTASPGSTRTSIDGAVNGVGGARPGQSDDGSDGPDRLRPQLRDRHRRRCRPPRRAPALEGGLLMGRTRSRPDAGAQVGFPILTADGRPPGRRRGGHRPPPAGAPGPDQLVAVLFAGVTGVLTIDMLAPFKTHRAGFQFVVNDRWIRPRHLAGTSVSTASRCSWSC